MSFRRVSTYLANTLGFASISDSLATVEAGGMLRLLFANRDTGEVRSIALGASGQAVTAQPVIADPTSGPDLEVQTTTSGPRLYSSPASFSQSASVTFAVDGTPSAAAALNASDGALTGVRAMEVIEFGATDVALVSRHGQAGLSVYTVSDAGVWTRVGTVNDGFKSHLEAVNAMASIDLGSKRLVVTTSALEDGITVLEVASNGGVQVVDAISAREGLWASGPSAVDVVMVAGSAYVIVASTGSSSLSVLRMNNLGVLFPTDHVTDSGETRIANIQAMDTVTVNGRSMIVAAGSDGGVSAFELLPGGKLSHLFATPFEVAPGLAAVTGIEARVVGADLAVFLTDATGVRVHHLAWSISDLGAIQLAGSGGGALTGGALDDRLIGGAGNDTVQGGAGADFIHDGAGSDQLTGGVAADVFVFARDGQIDRVMDFEKGIDRLDVSDWGRIFSASALTITSTATGAVISFGAEQLILTSSNGSSIAANSFSEADFLFV